MPITSRSRSPPRSRDPPVFLSYTNRCRPRDLRGEPFLVLPARSQPRNDDTGKATFSYLPPSSGRRCPEGAEVGSCYGLKKNVRYAFPRFVIPSAAEGSFSFPVSLFLRNAVYMKHRDPTSHGVRCFPLSAVLASFPDRSRTKKISRFRSK